MTPREYAPAQAPSIIFATNNAHKIEEIQAAIGDTLNVITLREAGIEAKTEPFEGTEADARAFVISKNIRRRHLTAKERRNFLIELVKAAPGKSDRVLAKEAGTTHPTIAKARKQAEATGKATRTRESRPGETRVGASGEGTAGKRAQGAGQAESR